jgi:apolipoprotein N-acyltransferase
MDTAVAARPAAAPSRTAGPLERLALRLAALSGWRRLALAFALGAASSLAMPPAYAVPVLLAAFPCLLWMLDGVSSARTAFAVGWTFGFGFFLATLYWVAWAFTVDLAAFFWLLPIIAAGLPALLALFPGMAAAVSVRIGLPGIARPLAFAALWGLGEWLRGHVLSGFPWGLMGYGWVGWPAMLQPVAWLGIYGLSLVTVAVACLPAGLVDPRRPSAPVAPKVALAALATGAAVILALGLAGAARLAAAPPAGTDAVPGVRLRLVQPNIGQKEKWAGDLRLRHFERHLEMSLADRDGVTHVVWPETAVPWDVARSPEVRRALAAAVPPGGLLLTGAPRVEDGPEGPRYFNSLVVLDDSGTVLATFDKFHLVPLGEYVPAGRLLRAILPIDTIAEGMSDFTPGPGPRTLSLPGLPPVAPLICYEVIFPGDVAPREPAARAQWLLNLTNDAWYGRTAGPHQHFAIARTRAVEEGVPLVRAAGTGISGVVDPWGRVVAHLALGAEGVVDAPLPSALAKPTIFVRYGDLVFWGIMALLGIAAASIRMVPNKKFQI